VHEYSLYIRDIKFHTGQISIGLKHPSVAGLNGYKCTIRQVSNNVVVREIKLQLEKTYTPQIIPGFLNIPNCQWEIELDEVLAFSGKIPSESSSLV
jgi:hypothetical protein